MLASNIPLNSRHLCFVGNRIHTMCYYMNQFLVFFVIYEEWRVLGLVAPVNCPQTVCGALTQPGWRRCLWPYSLGVQFEQSCNYGVHCLSFSLYTQTSFHFCTLSTVSKTSSDTFENVLELVLQP